MFTRSERNVLCVLTVITLVLFTIVAALSIEIVSQPPLDAISVYDLLPNDTDYKEYAEQLGYVPLEILQSYIANDWELNVDPYYIVDPSNQLSVQWYGATDYTSKIIWIGNPMSIIHEFGHYLDWELNDRAYGDSLYNCESQGAIEVLGQYASTNSREYFAEFFEYWIRNQNDCDAMERLREVAPKTYTYFLDLSQNSWGLDTSTIVCKINRRLEFQLGFSSSSNKN